MGIVAWAVRQHSGWASGLQPTERNVRLNHDVSRDEPGCSFQGMEEWMRRLLVLVVLALALVTCGRQSAQDQATSAEPPATVASSATSIEPADGLTGIGATNSVWNANHQADDRFAPGTVYDNGRYYAVIHNGRITSYSMHLPDGTSQANARAIAISELPADARYVWRANLDTCVEEVFRSKSLKEALGMSDVLIGFLTDGNESYDPSNVNDLYLAAGDYPTPSDAPGC